MAEGFFNKLSGGNPGIAESAALDQSEIMNPNVISLMDEEDIDMSDKHSKNITEDMIKEADFVIIMSHDLENHFNDLKKFMKLTAKLEVWNIEDAPLNKSVHPPYFKKTKPIIKEKVIDLINRIDKRD